MAARRFSATIDSFALSSASTSRETARSRADLPASIFAASYSPPAWTLDANANVNANANAHANALFVVLVFIEPDFLLRRPVFFVVLDQAFDVELAEHL